MRAVLVFTPQASPTYAPLGLASLSAYLRRELGGCELSLLDLNLEAWTSAAEQRAEGRSLLAVLRGEQAGFLDGATYEKAQQTWAQLAMELEQLATQAHRYASAQVDVPEPELARLLEAQLARVLALEPELVGLSILYPEQLVFAVALARQLRASRPRLHIVAGGAALSALAAEELLAVTPELDGLLLGEGEPGVAALCAAAPPASVPGLLYREGGALQRTPWRPLPVASLPAPDFSTLPLRAYWNPEPVLPALLGRGCAWRRCSFCAHNASFGRHRRKSVEAFAAELEALQARHGVRHLYLADQYVEAATLDELSQALLRRGLDLRFHVMARPTAQYTPGLLERAREAGCRWISWGIESGSQRLLELVRKGTRADQIPAVLRGARQAGISNLAMMIFGLPTSTDEDLEETLRLLEELRPDLDALTASSFVLFAGTRFGRQPERHGLELVDAHAALSAPRRVRSHRLTYRELGPDGARPPRAALELGAWERRRRWLAPLRFDHLVAEHYLLHAAR